MSSPESDTRNRILDAAWALLEAQGGTGVRMSDIAQRAGVSRQAVYLHFKTRAELLIATTRHIDDVKAVDERLAASRQAASGGARLDAFVEAWGHYIPEVYGVIRALLAMKDTDEAAAAAWEDRMRAVREGCAAAVDALAADGALREDYSPREATDLLSVLLSVRTWEQLTRDAGWPQERYIELIQTAARRLLTATEAPG